MAGLHYTVACRTCTHAPWQIYSCISIFLLIIIAAQRVCSNLLIILLLLMSLYLTNVIIDDVDSKEVLNDFFNCLRVPALFCGSWNECELLNPLPQRLNSNYWPQCRRRYLKGHIKIVDFYHSSPTKPWWSVIELNVAERALKGHIEYMQNLGSNRPIPIVQAL